MPRKKSTATTDAPTAVETEAITDAVEAAVEELENGVDNIDAEPTPVVACIGEDCEQFGHDKADRDVCLAGPTTGEGFPATEAGLACLATPVPKVVHCIGSNCRHYSIEVLEDGSERLLCCALPDEPPTELEIGEEPGETAVCIAPTLMMMFEGWEKLVEHDNGQLAVDVDTDDDVRDQVRERLFNDVLKAQDAVSKAVDKLGDARQAQRAAETFLEKYDAWQADVTATITELKAELREQGSDVNDTSLSNEDVNQDEAEGGESDDTYPGNMLEPGDMGYSDDDPGEKALANEEPADAES
jgi:hypothetical protein